MGPYSSSFVVVSQILKFSRFEPNFLPLATSFSRQVSREQVGQARQACLLFCGLSFELIKYESYIKARASELEIRLAPSQAGTSLELEPKN